MNTEQLSEAFRNFSTASKSLELYYEKLQEKVRYLTAELERKNTQLADALDEAERNREYLNAILYSLEEAIIVVDSEERITMINRSAESLLGIDLLAVMGRKYEDMHLSITGSDSDTTLTVGGVPHSVILSRSHVVHPDGQIRGSVILIKDITRLRELEHQHERNQRLVAMGEMSAQIVHEIRNPLCSIALFASMLEQDLRDPGQKDLAHGISEGIGSLNGILKNMLFFARPNKPLMKTVNLRNVMEDSLKLFAPLARSRNISIEHSLSDSSIKGDAELLKQVFANIIVNAIQAMPDGGRLSVETGKKDKHYVVDIGDTGEGIEQKFMESIFNPFFSTKDKGTGLGLAIASMIMQRHDGYIRVTSREGEGSVFSLGFPEKEDL
ncbi:MAG TPA: ATP-binding protein [Thermodesulfovibrionales bacterium]|nr:ATP-binding protein [Thermodesulfovibrionales bacterium]